MLPILMKWVGPSSQASRTLKRAHFTPWSLKPRAGRRSACPERRPTWHDEGLPPARQGQRLDPVGVTALVAGLSSNFPNKYFPSRIIQHATTKRRQSVTHREINRLSNQPPSLRRARRAGEWAKVYPAGGPPRRCLRRRAAQHLTARSHVPALITGPGVLGRQRFLRFLPRPHEFVVFSKTSFLTISNLVSWRSRMTPVVLNGGRDFLQS